MTKELVALGERPRAEKGGGGVEWEGDARSLMRANLWLRTASRVVVRVARFRATAFFELEKRAKKIPWGDFLETGTQPKFRVTTHKSKLYHSDAIAERLQAAAHLPRTDGGEAAGREQIEQLFVVRANRDEFMISADASGELLHMRGYRKAVAKAPLRETLAAALLLAADWRGDAPLADPFCGSGTIPIEGALIAQRIAPGLKRRFAFMSWPNFDKKVWKELADEAQSRVLASSPVPIRGSDRDAGAVESAKANAERAGVDVAFETRAVSALEATGESGLVATNPPYGVRTGASATLRNLYARFGQVVRERCPGWRVAMFAADTRLASQAELATRELFRTSNGGIAVVALGAEVPK